MIKMMHELQIEVNAHGAITIGQSHDEEWHTVELRPEQVDVLIKWLREAKGEAQRGEDR
jgi:hypothetical protein